MIPLRSRSDSSTIGAGHQLRARRPEIYGRRTDNTSTPVDIRLTLEESEERLRQLGIELPMFEGDQVEDHTIPLIEDARKTEDDPSRE
jgi:hypothetical protein